MGGDASIGGGSSNIGAGSGDQKIPNGDGITQGGGRPNRYVTRRGDVPQQ